jgi:hypothetical protein
MNKQLLTIGAISASIIFIPALLIAFGVFLILGYFWGAFIISCGIIFIIGELSNQYYQRRISLDVQNYQAKIQELKSEQSVGASCAYCKQRLTIPIKLSQRNTHECPLCKQTNLVIFQFTTAQITTPLELPQMGSMPNNVPNDVKNEQQ